MGDGLIAFIPFRPALQQNDLAIDWGCRDAGSSDAQQYGNMRPSTSASSGNFS